MKKSGRRKRSECGILRVGGRDCKAKTLRRKDESEYKTIFKERHPQTLSLENESKSNTGI